MTERRHRPALDQSHIGSTFGPQGESVPWKLGSPSEPANDRLQQPFDQVPKATIRTDPAEEDHLPARSEHSGTLVKRCLRVWHRRNYVIGHDDVERIIGECQMLRIHYLQRLDVGEGQFGHALPRFAEHLFRKIDPDYAILTGIAGERDARADTDFENSTSDPLGSGDCRAAPALEHRAKDQIVHGRPARIRLP